jgi:predicted ABC-type ATPase
MPHKTPHLFIIAGPNGAGKTTSAMKLLPEYLQCEEYVNADNIANGLSQFKPESVAIEAGRAMLSRIHELCKQRKSFAFESTLASRTFVMLLTECKLAGYSTNIIFLWLQSPTLAVKRVALRVQKGGHSIPSDIICRRYSKGIEYFFNLYLPVVDNWTMYDNSNANPDLIARKYAGTAIEIGNDNIWNKLQRKRYEPKI